MKKIISFVQLALFCQISFSQNIITTIAGTGSAGYSGDGGPATSATLNFPVKVAIDSSGNIYFADDGNNAIRRIDVATGTITTVAGNGTAGYSGDGGPSTAAVLNGPWGVALDSAGNIFFSDVGNNVIRRIDAGTGIISTVIGNGSVGYSGDGGPALSASFNGVTGLAIDKHGNFFVTDDNNNVIRRIDAVTNVVTTIAGNGVYGYGGDGGPATNAILSFPVGISAANGNIYLTDSDNDRIRMINNSGIISTIAGNGSGGYNGDGIPATSAALSNPWDAVTDAAGNLYIADFYNCRIRKVDATTGLISTYAGGTCGYSGDGGPATSAAISAPTGLCLNRNGELIFMDTYNNVVRKVAAPLSPLAGNLQLAVPGCSGFPNDPSTSGGLCGEWTPYSECSITICEGTTLNHVYLYLDNNTAGTFHFNSSFALSVSPSGSNVVITNAGNNSPYHYFNVTFNSAGTYQIQGIFSGGSTANCAPPDQGGSSGCWMSQCTNYVTVTVLPANCKNCPQNLVCKNTHSGRTSVQWQGNSTTSINTSFSQTDFTGLPGADVVINSPTTSNTTANINFIDCTFLMYPGSKIRINAKNTTTTPHINTLNVSFTNCHLYGCCELWEGIRFTTDAIGEMSGNIKVNLTLDNTFLEDAWIGIDNADLSNNSGFVITPKISLKNSMFNKNSTDLHLDQDFLDGSSYSQKTVYTCRQVPYLNPFSPVLPTFFTAPAYFSNYLNSVAAANVLPSSIHGFSGATLSTYGIILFFSQNYVSSQMQSFNLSAQSNIFDRHLYGIFGQGIDLTISRQYFYNIPFTALLSNGYLGGIGSPPTLQLGSSTATANYFVDCGTGIFTRYKTASLTASYNNFRRVGYGIHVNTFSSYSNSYNCTMVKNILVDVQLAGIWMDLNGTINADIEFNQLYYSSPSARNFSSIGIRANEMNNPFALYNISNNNMQYVFTGIDCNTTSKTQIISNTIQLNSPSPHGPNIYNYGINNYNCYNNSIGENKITGDNLPYNYGEYGINSVAHPMQNIYCNTISGVNTGLNLQDVSPTPMNPEMPIRNNDLTECLIDVWMLNGCILGPQRFHINIFNTTINFPVDNAFHHTSTATTYTSSYCSGNPNITNGNNSRFYIRGPFPGVVPYNMPNNYALGTPPSTAMNPFYISGNFPNQSPCNVSGSGHRVINLAHAIAADSLIPVINKRDHFVGKRALYNNLMTENVPTNSDPVLTSFKNAESATSVGTLFSIEKSINDGLAQNNPALISVALQSNSSFNPSDSIELLHKKVNNAYLSYLNNGYNYTSNELLTLRQIAPLCPFTYGTAVWQARSLLAGVDSLPYQNNCEGISFPANGQRTMANVEDGASIGSGSKIYPNPNTGTFTIDIPYKAKKLNVEIYNALGEEVVNKTFDLDNSTKVEIQNFDNGVYTIRLIIDGIHNKTERIIITK